MQLVTLNQLGNVQIPENIRQKLGLNQESKLSLEVENGKLILTPIQDDQTLYYEGHVLVSNADLPEDVNNIIEELRNSRDNQLMSW